MTDGAAGYTAPPPIIYARSMSESAHLSNDETMELPPGYTRLGYSLTWYEKVPGNALAGECPQAAVSQDDLKILFGLTSSAVVDCLAHPVTQAHLPFLGGHAACDIDLTAYDYFVEGWALP